jgi:16S rRNA (guanine(966)-N(2))-methyltransferase RsmD
MSALRIISGKAKGRKLRTVPGETTRPITDKVRQALFNIIGPDIQGANLLDLFAGTGSVGIEALSRGARYVLFIDKNRQPFLTIKANLKDTNLEKDGEVLQTDAFSYLERKPDHKFDYVYIAPPQYNGLWKQAIIALDSHPEWLSEDAWVIVQIHPVEYEKLGMHYLSEFDLRSYGSTMLIFYQIDVGE